MKIYQKHERVFAFSQQDRSECFGNRNIIHDDQGTNQKAFQNTTNLFKYGQESYGNHR